jgi:hypothetical protein
MTTRAAGRPVIDAMSIKPTGFRLGAAIAT